MWVILIGQGSIEQGNVERSIMASFHQQPSVCNRLRL
jgi:hypothetical protein